VAVAEFSRRWRHSSGIAPADRHWVDAGGEQRGHRGATTWRSPNAISRSVSREHAHILFDKERGEYRFVNDRWYKTTGKADANCGLCFVRDGLSRPIHRSARGVTLLPCDEIRLGQAVIRFVVR